MKSAIIAVVLFVAIFAVGCADGDHLGSLDELVKKAPCGATVTYEDDELKVEITKSCPAPAEAPKPVAAAEPVAQKTEPTPADKK